MKASHQAYARAHARLAAATTEMEAARHEVEVAEAAVRNELDAAWEANRQSLQDALTAVDDAMQRRLAIEEAVGAACQAERRKPTDEEMTRCWQAREVWLAAKEAVPAAQETFKAGVTVDQLGEAAKRLAAEQ